MATAKDITDKMFGALREQGYQVVPGILGESWIKLEEEKVASLRFEYKGNPKGWTISCLNPAYRDRIYDLGTLMEKTARETSAITGFSLDRWLGIIILDENGKQYKPERVEPPIIKLSPKVFARKNNPAIITKRRKTIRKIIYDSEVPLCTREVRILAGPEMKWTAALDVYVLKKAGELIIAETRDVNGTMVNFYARKDYKRTQ